MYHHKITPKQVYHLRSGPQRLKKKKQQARTATDEQKKAKKAVEKARLSSYFEQLYLEIQVTDKTTGPLIASKLIGLKEENAVFAKSIELDGK